MATDSATSGGQIRAEEPRPGGMRKRKAVACSTAAPAAAAAAPLTQRPAARRAISARAARLQGRTRHRDLPTPGAVTAPGARPTGALYVVGTGGFGQLGLGEDVVEKLRPSPLEIGDGEPVTAVAAGGMHSVVITRGGVAYTWGVNDDGQLGRKVRAALLEALQAA